jgi:hypothetical protein
MEQEKYNFGPIKLINTSKYMPKGYRTCEIMQAYYRILKGEKFLTVEFQVAVGKYKGFKLTTNFYLNFKGKVRLSYLCTAVGISGELNNPAQLIGKKVKLRVVPKRNYYMGKTYINYIITRFHPIDRDI